MAEQLGPRGRDCLIALAEAGSESAFHALARGFAGDELALARVKKVAEGHQDDKRRARALGILRDNGGGELPMLRVPEARRY